MVFNTDRFNRKLNITHTVQVAAIVNNVTFIHVILILLSSKVVDDMCSIVNTLLRNKDEDD